MLTPAQAAKDPELKLGRSARTIREMCSRGELPCYEDAGGYLLDRDEVIAFRKAQKKGPANQA